MFKLHRALICNNVFYVYSVSYCMPLYLDLLMSSIFFWRMTLDSFFNCSPSWIIMRSSNQGVYLLRMENSSSCQEKAGSRAISYWYVCT